MPNRKVPTELRKRAEARLRGARTEANLPGMAHHDVLALLHELQVHQVEMEMQNEELIRIRDEAADTHRTYIDLYDLAPVGYLTLDATGSIRKANLAGASLLGVPRGSLIGRRVAQFLVPGSRPAFADFLAAVISGRKGMTCDLALETEGDGPAHVHLAGTAIKGVSECRITLVDVTERRRAEDALRESEARIRQLNVELEDRVADRTAELVETNRELDAFAYSVSHDLRAPLRAIEGFSAILLQESGERLNAEDRRLLGVVRTNTMKMARLIDDLLAFSRAGRHEIRHARVAMRSLAQSAFDELAGSADARARIDFRMGALPDAEGDPSLLRQVWLNLLSNALKYSATQGRPLVEVDGEVAGQQAVFRVRDNGVGFDPKFTGKLFGVFQRLHGVKEFEGTGIGLALVRRIVEKHGGLAWAEGEIGKGATFSFSLPVVARSERSSSWKRTEPEEEPAPEALTSTAPGR